VNTAVHENSDVLIINPPWESALNEYGCRSNTRWPHLRSDKFLLFPIYLAYTAALVEREGIKTTIIDAVADDLDSKKFISVVKRKKPKYCFIESSTPTISQDLNNAKAVKENTLSKVFLMGAHPTVFQKEIIMKNPWLDGIIRGEFELTVRDISCGRDYSNVSGLTYYENNEVVINPERALISDLDILPFPAWHLFDLKKYESHLYSSPSALIIATRGCPFHCTYCLWPQVLYGHKQRRRSPHNICNEIEKLIEMYKIRHVRFDDDTFALNSGYVKDCCREIIKRKLNKRITWNCFGHISQPDLEMYKLMAKAGCRKIAVGIESGSEKILRIINKKINIKKAKETVSNCRKAGIEIYCDFMIGFPHETENDILKSIEMAIDLDPDYIQVSYAVPYPGTKMYNQGIKDNFLRHPRKWQTYASCEPMIDTGSISLERIEKLYNEFWYKFYLRPSYIARNARKALQSRDNFFKITKGFVSFFNRFIRR